MKLSVLLIFLVMMVSSMCTVLSIASASPLDRFSSMAHKAIEEKLPNANIKFPSIHLLEKNAAFQELSDVLAVKLLEDRPNGMLLLEVSGIDQNNDPALKRIQLPYEAWVSVPVANKRVPVNSALQNADFRVQQVNVASGRLRDYRGIFAPTNFRFEKVLSKQTILEGQALTTASYIKTPDLKRGDMVRLELISGDLVLTTQGVAQEPATIGDRVRVITNKTKREVVGVLREDRSVEVAI